MVLIYNSTYNKIQLNVNTEIGKLFLNLFNKHIPAHIE